jgi:endonuclease-3 related protein
MPASKSVKTHRTLKEMYRALHDAYGPQHWWPGESPTEVIIGAILTQNTNWKNVERAIANLRDRRMLDWKELQKISVEELAQLIRPAGYYNIKARRLKHFVHWLWTNHDGSLDNLKCLPLPALREELLSINGIGPETADSILLYALNRPSFVIDAYTTRLLRRHALISEDAKYHDMKDLFERALPAETQLFNEFHALIVTVAKKHCRKRAACEGCPLDSFPHEREG